MAGIADLIGNTPMVELQRLNKKKRCKNIRETGRQ